MEAAGGQTASQGPVQRRQAQGCRPRLPAGPFQDPELLAQLADAARFFSSTLFLRQFHMAFRPGGRQNRQPDI
jgi:hypothetical protein